jgi:hypothetical protein
MTIEYAAEKRGVSPVPDTNKQVIEVVRAVLDYNFPAEEGEAIIESMLRQDSSADLTSTTKIYPDPAKPALPEQNRPMIPGFIRNVFKPKVSREEKEEKEIERMESANRLERLATKAYLEGQITLRDYQLLNELTFPITKLDLRKLAQNVGRGH